MYSCCVTGHGVDIEIDGEKKLKRLLLLKEFLAETIATFIFVTIGLGSIANHSLKSQQVDSSLSIPLAFGIGALIAICFAGPISGAHFNPALTLAFAVSRKIPWIKVPVYCLGQYLGSFLAAAIIFLVYFEAIDAYDGGQRSAWGNSTSTGGIFATYPFNDVSIYGVFIDQTIGTFILSFGIYMITDEKSSKISFPTQALFICLLITGLGIGFNLNCGASFNPARDLSPRVFTAIVGYGKFPFCPLDGFYWAVGGLIGPHLGGILGGLAYSFAWNQLNIMINSNNNNIDDVALTTTVLMSTACPDYYKARMPKTKSQQRLNQPDRLSVNDLSVNQIAKNSIIPLPLPAPQQDNLDERNLNN